MLERAGVRGLNAAMLWETPSARINCSLSSTLVRPLAVAASGALGLGKGQDKIKPFG